MRCRVVVSPEIAIHSRKRQDVNKCRWHEQASPALASPPVIDSIDTEGPEALHITQRDYLTQSKDKPPLDNPGETPVMRCGPPTPSSRIAC